MTKKAKFIFKFLGVGWLYLSYILCMDVANFVKILTMHKGCKAHEGLDQQDSDDDLVETRKKRLIEIECYNEIRQVVINMFIKQRKGVQVKEEGTDIDLSSTVSQDQ